MSLKALHETGRWCQVRILPHDHGVAIQVQHSTGGPATTAKVEQVPWEQFDNVPAVVNRLAGEIVEQLAKE